MPRPEDVITTSPVNIESAWAALAERRTPVDGFFVRDHHAVPKVRADAWRLHVCGFDREVTLSFDELRQRPSVQVDAVLECAGNGRSYFAPRAEGLVWRERAVGCATFGGTPLAGILDEVGIPSGTVEILFRGADSGERGGPPRYERSLPLEVARAEDTLLVWEMNGAPLRTEHGAPVRLLVPSWYGMASVKWLAEVRALARPFEGRYQTESYVYQSSPGDARPEPVREKRVNSLVVAPVPDARIEAGRRSVASGWAWSGAAPIARVEVSTDGGGRWVDAELDAPPSSPHAWRGWHHAFVPAEGELVLLARAHDEAGNVQPERAAWNVQGYGHHAPKPRRVVAFARKLA